MEFNVKELSIGCFYILLGKAQINFPTTDKSHPSYLVMVDKGMGKPIRDGDWSYFPFYVNWEVWQKVVVPILKDPTNEIWTNEEPYLKNFQNWYFLSIGDYERLLLDLNAALIRGLQEQGFLPVEPETEPIEYWSDGQPKLEYPKVK